jgi:GT2 family glycosyltransferase
LEENFDFSVPSGFLETTISGSKLKKVLSVIVAYNGGEWIRNCIESLTVSEYPTDILVIDNGSTDNTIDIIQTGFPGIRLVKSSYNLGFGQANNLGLKEAVLNDYDFVFLLNQDAWINSSTLKTLIATQEENTDFGILSPLHLNSRGNRIDKYFFDYLLQSECRQVFEDFLLRAEHSKKIIPTSFVNAAAWLLSKDCLYKTGGFDPLFFHYGEDRNYAKRVIYHGYKIGIILDAVIFHDREDRIKNKRLDLLAIIQREKVEFLNYASDIEKRKITIWTIRRFTGHLFYFFTAGLTLNRFKMHLNFQMAKHSLLSFKKILKSRSSFKRPGAFLQVGYKPEQLVN